ncbi:MAG: phosphoribosylamine--glycine ligase [Candidatus Obscuribacterales bacterium]|nr:phosphoribosylamine--glycine ligase [Candidatus Obscuribacterales bacterium]
MKIEKAKVLVLGSGGREHALAWKLAQSPQVTRVWVSPGNAGTAGIADINSLAGTANIYSSAGTANTYISAGTADINNLSTTDNSSKLANLQLQSHDEIVAFAKANVIDLVVVGPEGYLRDGIVDSLNAAGILAFGPTAEESRLEWSKAHAKELMLKLSVPTAAFKVADSPEQAIDFLAKDERLRVVKYDGLAAGKGVYVVDSLAEAVEAVHEIKKGQKDFKVVLEEKLFGEELSLFCLCDGKKLLPLSVSQDHKRRFEGDIGPNTGGMGAYLPVAAYDQSLADIVEERIIARLEQGLRDGVYSFKGLLFIGLLLDAQKGVNVLEFNTRFGDPETEAVLPLLQEDLFTLLTACAEGRLVECSPPQLSAKASVTIIAVTENYPAQSSRGVPIKIGTMPEGVTLFHCGTTIEDGNVVTNGGRILAPTAVAETVEEARSLALAALKEIEFAGLSYRTDIAKRGGLCRSNS